LTPSPDVTDLLVAWNRGDRSALDELMPAVYGELRRLARSYLARERRDHTLETTGLVHEAYLKLVDQRRVAWQNRAHFFGVAAQIMRRILVDHARSRAAQKRGDGRPLLSLAHVGEQAAPGRVDLLSLDHALIRLATFDARQSRIVELRFFAGLSLDETAEALGLSPATVSREWTMARAWLHREMLA
jgi:RNA polymerase sigma factor (TIGR02999 family)